VTTGWTYEARWPVLDIDRTLSMLREEAEAEIDATTAEDGARIVGDITWSIDGEEVVARAPAVPTADQQAGRARHGSVERHADRIAAMAKEHMTDRRIAEVLGCTPSAVAKVRARHHIAPGVGTGPIPPVGLAA
jgi:hypothetical protein